MMLQGLKLSAAAIGIVFAAITSALAQQVAGDLPEPNLPRTQTQVPDLPPPPAPGTVAAPTPPPVPAAPAPARALTEVEIEHMLIGKTLFLRGGYLADRLLFDGDGRLIGNSLRGSYTLCAVHVQRVHLTDHTLELIGQRYALQFPGTLAYDASSDAVEQVLLTPRHQSLRITIDRKQFRAIKVRTARHAHPASPAVPAPDRSDPVVALLEGAPAPTPASAPAPAPAPAPAQPATPRQRSDQALRLAIDRVFAVGIDSRLVAAMPAFWQPYYESQTGPADPTILGQDSVDRKARLLTAVVPPSNAYAVRHKLMGNAVYQVVVDAEGKPAHVAVARPIGFGLDEETVAAIRQATFEPAMKNGVPVPVRLDMVVDFRLYSNRTSEGAEASALEQPLLPGPYSIQAQR